MKYYKQAINSPFATQICSNTAAAYDGLVSCSQIIGQSIRLDISMMFGQFHVQKATLGAKEVLRLNKEKPR
ncbi:hypothetical protein [Paraliobacillus sediminis]|uniref:hypothetical protein n=1 Tax=Paraliobacillus sediminis TaxID=1885916 RepID=UPI003B830235